MTLTSINFVPLGSDACSTRPTVGQTVAARGYVSAVSSTGFYMQQSASGSLWGGIFVHLSAVVANPSLDSRAVGDYVEVVAVVAE